MGGGPQMQSWSRVGPGHSGSVQWAMGSGQTSGLKEAKGTPARYPFLDLGVGSEGENFTVGAKRLSYLLASHLHWAWLRI